MAEVSATKLAPLVLICIMVFAVVIGIGLTLATNISALSKANGAPSSIDRLFGEVVNDPKPNRIITLRPS